MNKLAEHIRIVLVNTSHPGNIGACARVMKNMGLRDLYLVAPDQFPHAKASAMASGADDILANAVVVEDLATALKGCFRVFATSARKRRIKDQQLLPPEAARMALSLDQQHKIAFVFGRERTGLENQELAQCEYQIIIPTNPQFPSLNLASAVQILCYELSRQVWHNNQNAPQKTRQQTQQPVQAIDDNLAGHDALEYYFQHLEKTLADIGFLNIKQSPQIMLKLRHLYQRAQVSQNELNILRGILTAIDNNLHQ